MIHAAAAVPGVACDSLLSSGGAAAVGGSSARGGPTSPRAAAPSTAAPQDPGRRHLNQDGSRAGTCGARSPSEPEADAERREVREICAVSLRTAGLTMAQETRLAISGPPGSQALLDSLLQNLYDFGECGASEPTWRADLRTPDLAGLRLLEHPSARPTWFR